VSQLHHAFNSPDGVFSGTPRVKFEDGVSYQVKPIIQLRAVFFKRGPVQRKRYGPVGKRHIALVPVPEQKILPLSLRS
jgi:hypothetical protein